MPKVSVIVPVYGVEKYIERCARLVEADRLLSGYQRKGGKQVEGNGCLFSIWAM